MTHSGLLHESREVFANSTRQNPFVLIRFLKPVNMGSASRTLQYFPGCAIPCLPPRPQQMSSCILTPFKLSPFLAVGSSYECQVQPRHLKEGLP